MLPGYFPRNSAGPGTDTDNALRRRAGWPGVVIRLRFLGHYLPMHLILARPNPSGLVISEEFEGVWSVDLHPESGVDQKLLHTLMEAREVRRRPDGCILLTGMEWDEGYLGRHQQTWLCAPEWSVGMGALQEMSAWLKAQYPRKD